MEIVKSLLKVNWQNEVDIPKKMTHQIGDYLIDEVRDVYHLPISFEEIDMVAERCVNVAKIRYKKMKEVIQFGSKQIEFYVEYSDRKSLGITITPDLTILVKAPVAASI